MCDGEAHNPIFSPPRSYGPPLRRSKTGRFWEMIPPSVNVFLLFPRLRLLLQRTSFTRLLWIKSGHAGQTAAKNGSNASAASVTYHSCKACFNFRPNHLHYNHERCCFVCPSPGVSSLSVSMKYEERITIRSPPITHIHYFGDKSSRERRRAWFVSGSPGHRQLLPVTYLPLPLPFSISKREMFT